MNIKYPGRIIHIIGLVLAGFFFFSTLINTIWPDNIRSDFSNLNGNN